MIPVLPTLKQNINYAVIFCRQREIKTIQLRSNKVIKHLARKVKKTKSLKKTNQKQQNLKSQLERTQIKKLLIP